jgi:preprotein translocase subunit SecD
MVCAMRRLVAALGMFTLLAAGAAGCSSPHDVAVFRMLSGPARLTPLAADVPVISVRLHALGDAGAGVVARGDTLVVQGGGPLPAPASFFVRSGHLSFRPVLCGAPDYAPPSTGQPPSEPMPSCGPQYRTSAANLAISSNSTGAEGCTSANVPPDPSFAVYPSAPNRDADEPSTTVLLSPDPAAGQQQYPRFVLGPAQLQGKVFASMTASYDRTLNGWAVKGTFTRAASEQWDRVTMAGFHQYVAADLDGLVLWAPIIQPTQAAFTSFQGRFELTGSFTKTAARQLAALFMSGPLPVPLM